MLKTILKKIVPKQIFLLYHWLLAHLAAFIYGHPSKKLIVIGVTGTGGKSTVVNLIGRILEEAGFKVGWASTCNFKINKKEWLNTTKMTMLGRFALQRFLKQMVTEGCKYAVIETSSEGIKQFRHLGIDYDLAVFTNLSPEHIESHGSLEKYRQAKEKLFKRLVDSKRKRIKGQEINKTSVVNLSDPAVRYFLKYSPDQIYGYGYQHFQLVLDEHGDKKKTKMIKAENLEMNPDGVSFEVAGVKMQTNLLAEFNVFNCLAAICVALSQGIGLSACQSVLSRIQPTPGRMEIIQREPFMVVVDYAHTPDSLKQVYLTLNKLKESKNSLIGLLGSAGGGRDKWKRSQLGALADYYCQKIIITNEDPYNENPEEIIKQVASGIKNLKKKIGNKVFQILDRESAIKKTLELAQPGDIVVITGKGCEQCMMVKNSAKIPWDDRKIVKELLNQAKDFSG